MTIATIPLPLETDLSGGTAKRLRSFMERQSQSNWCWAACGASVGNYYHGSGSYTQCGIANKCQGKKTCCTNASGCNQYGRLDKALEAANSYDTKAAAKASFTTLHDHIDNNQPVGARVKWNGSGAHVMMITGYDTEGEKITIQDPALGTTTIAYASYPAKYHNGGTWTHTYFTKS